MIYYFYQSFKIIDKSSFLKLVIFREVVAERIELRDSSSLAHDVLYEGEGLNTMNSTS